MRANDIHTMAYVLRRTNYGEADRILNLITPAGKLSALAKGARKERSKLAGGIEMFSLIDVNVHLGKSDLGILTSAKMLNHYGNLLIDLDTLELASLILKKVSLAADSSDSPDHFRLVDQTLFSLNRGIKRETVETWFLFNYVKALGEQVNLYCDVTGAALNPELRYFWDSLEGALKTAPAGDIGKSEIKIMRLMLSSDLSVVSRIQNLDAFIPSILKIAHFVAHT